MRMLLLGCSIIFILVKSGEASITEYRQTDFLATWKDIRKTIYDGESFQKLINMCPNGCTTGGGDCDSFPLHTFDPSEDRKELPCTEDDIIVLRKAQEIVRDWEKAISNSKKMLIIRSISVGIIFILIVVLIIRGHYRFRDLLFLPSDRQWQSELDPTWGLPGKVWSLLKIRVVTNKNSEPTERKYLSYTENPTVMGNKFWYYKHALRDMYKSHKYYKRNRYFHKLAWQFTKLGRLVPETLRQHKKMMRRAGELEGAKSPEGELDPQQRLPWEIDLAHELNQVYLRRAKQVLKRQIQRDKAEGRFACGRYAEGHKKQRNLVRIHNPHLHHQRFYQSAPEAFHLPLGKAELERTANEMESNPNANYVMVDGAMKMHPSRRKQHQTNHHQHQRHTHHHAPKNPRGSKKAKSKTEKRSAKKKNKKFISTVY